MADEHEVLEEGGNDGPRVASPSIWPYDFKHPARVNKEQLRAIENVHDQFARLLSSAFSGAMRAVVDVDMAFVDQTTYAEYIASLSNPSCSYQFTLGPTNGQVIIDVPPSLLFAFIDRAFGGKGSARGMDSRQVTPIEIGVINRIIKRVIEGLETTWAPVLNASIYDIELETNPEFMQITSANEIVILLAFQIESAHASGLFTLCYPFFTLESILPLLDVQVQVQKDGAISRQEQRLANRLRLADMEVGMVTEVGRVKMKLADVRELAVGNIVRLAVREQAPLTILLGGKAKYLARPFRTDTGELALKVVGQVPRDYQYRYGYIEMYTAARKGGDGVYEAPASLAD